MISLNDALGSHQSSASTNAPHIVAVVVTNDRPSELAQLLDAITIQTVKVDRIIVVDNGGSRETPSVVDSRTLCERINGRTNLGGAGGFALGMLHALTTGADLVWVMDDDGRPASAETLARLVTGLHEQKWDAASPLVLDASNPTRSAFPFKIGLKVFSRADDLRQLGQVKGFAHLFNGLLIRSGALMRTGVPDLRLFYRGDEIDFHLRMQALDLKFGTLTDAEFLHPPSWQEIVPLVPGLLHAVYPPDIRKQRTFFRNRGYLIRHHRLALVILRDIVVYPWLFIVQRRGDFAGLKSWAAATWAGANNKF